MVAAAAVQQAALHAAAKGAQGVALELALRSAVDDGVGEVVVGYAELGEVGDERRRVEGRRHGVDLLEKSHTQKGADVKKGARDHEKDAAE